MSNAEVLNEYATRRLGECLREPLQTGFASGDNNRTGDGVPHVRPMNVSVDGKLTLRDLKFVPRERVPGAGGLLRFGDVVFNNTNSPELVGKTALYELPEERAFSNHMTRIRTDPDVLDARYCAYALHGKWREGYFEAVCNNHVSQASVSREKLMQTEIPLPPVEEQRRIAAKLDEVLDRLASSRERLDRVPKTLRRFRQSVFSAAASGRLTEHMNGGGNNGAIPEGWTMTPFAHLTENFDGKRIPIKASDRGKRHGTYPYYGASGVIDHIDDFLFEGDYLLVSEDGANLLARATPIAFQASGQFWVNNHAHVVQSRPDVRIAYLEIVINGMDIQDFVTGSAQPKLTQGALNRILVPLPPLNEQDAIVDKTTRLLTWMSNALARCTSAKAQTERIVEAVFSRAFRGQLVPRPGDSRGGGDYGQSRRTNPSYGGDELQAATRIDSNAAYHGQEGADMISKADVAPNHLAALLEAAGPLSPEELWTRSQLSIDDFYDQLRAELVLGRIDEVREGSGDHQRRMVAQ